MVPGYRGYRDRELRRDEDSRLRAHLLQRLSSIRESLSDLITAAGAELSDGCGEILDRKAARLDGVADAIRYAPYGFSGFFDAIEIREDALDRILEADLLLFDDLDAIERAVDRIPIRPRATSRFRVAVLEIDERIENLERHLITRDKLLGDV
jgi:hypothetical protein